jgi:site-specific DNA recombinase
LARVSAKTAQDKGSTQALGAVRGRDWPTLVSVVTHNPILKGYRRRNQRVSRRVNKTGRHRSEKTTKELQLFRHVPHLAFIEPDRYDRIIGMLKERNAKYRRNGDGNGDPRRNVPRKRTRFPGQMLFCGICGRKFVFGGHGRTTPLMCNGAPEHRCWNGSTIDGRLLLHLVAREVVQRLRAEQTQPQGPATDGSQ